MFGPDRYLYVGLGDGGGSNDPRNDAQNPFSLLGKMLRLDLAVSDSDVNGYRIRPTTRSSMCSWLIASRTFAVQAPPRVYFRSRPERKRLWNQRAVKPDCRDDVLISAPIAAALVLPLASP